MITSLQVAQTNIPPGFIDLGAGEPQLDLLPLDMLRDAATHRLGQGEREFLQYGVEQGDGYFRAALAKFLSPRYECDVSHEGLFTTTGISSALDLLCTLYTQPGDTVFVEEPTYFLALRIFADHGLRVISISTDENGLDLDEMKQALKEYQPKFVYVIPSFQNPSGHTLPLERRARLIELAQKHNFLIIADEVYQFLGYTQTPPTSFGAHIDSGHVIALGSFSKILAPGLRLGWLHSNPNVIQRVVTSGVLDSAGGLNPFTSAIVRSLIEKGDLDKNIASLVDELGGRMKAMDGAIKKYLPQIKYTSPHGGYFFWLQAPGVDAQELQKKAKEFKVGLRPGIRFSSRDGLTEYFRLSISHYGVNDIEEGILRLMKCLES